MFSFYGCYQFNENVTFVRENLKRYVSDTRSASICTDNNPGCAHSRQCTGTCGGVN